VPGDHTEGHVAKQAPRGAACRLIEPPPPPSNTVGRGVPFTTEFFMTDPDPVRPDQRDVARSEKKLRTAFFLGGFGLLFVQCIVRNAACVK